MTQPAEPMRVRVMTYNLLYGFHERTTDGLLYQPARALAAREVVHAESPDILALTEAAYCDDRWTTIREDFVALFGLPHLFAAGFPGDFGNCLLSRFPIVKAERHALGGGSGPPSALRVVLDVGEGRRALHVDVVHPSPRISESERVAAFEPLLASLASPHIMVGDFNALSDEDPYEHARLTAQMKAYNVSNPEAVATVMLDRQLLAATRARGLRDALPVDARKHTIPTKLPRPNATQGAELRIDYVLVTNDINVRGGRIIQSDLTDKVSDHYPVVVDLDLP